MRPADSWPDVTDKEDDLMAVFTVSRTYGLFVEEMLQEFSQKNKMDIFSHQLLMEVAKSVRQPLDKIEDLYSMDSFNSFKIFIAEMLQSMADSSSLMVTGSQIDAPVYFPLFFPTLHGKEEEKKIENRKSYTDLMKKVIEDLYRKGDVIIIGRGAQIILHDYPDVVHLRFDASPEYRIRAVAERDKISADEAEDKIKKIDKKRRDYIDYFYGKKVDSPDLYDMIINVERLRGKTLAKVLQSLV
jgi:hypothetical protein